MGAKEVGNIIAAINPDLFFSLDPKNLIKSKAGRAKLKTLVKEHGAAKGLKEAKERDIKVSSKPVSSFKMTYDTQQTQLEPIYYWILDFIQDMGIDVTKVTDNFTSSPGSGHFAEIGQRSTRMQEEGMKILGGLNQVIKSALNLIYDLKEFKMRLAHYDDASSENKNEREEGMLALKQIWLDNVDLKRGRGSIHQMAAELGFSTLREAFMMANSTDDLKKMNSEDDSGGIINDQVMRILIPRISEFLKWQDYSHKELKKRFNIEKSYLKSQVETIKMYSAWMKPYLEAAEKLKQEGFEGNAALVNAFSTTMFELTLFGKVKKEENPPGLENYHQKRDYNGIVVVGFKYRGHVSQRVTQKGDYGFAMGGRVDMTFDSYALNSEEIEIFKKEIEKKDVEDALSFDIDLAADALKELKEDLDEFLGDDKKEEEKKKEGQDINPFGALFSGLFKKVEGKKKKGKLEGTGDIRKDNYVEKRIRALASKTATARLYSIYDIYKKAHGMASSPEDFDNESVEVPSEATFGEALKGREK
jgi:hypothetical protein